MGIDPTRVIQIGQPMQGNNSCKKKGHKKKAEKLSKTKKKGRKEGQLAAEAPAMTPMPENSKRIMSPVEE